MSVVTDRRSGDGDRARTARGLSVEPPPTRRRRRLPELAVGALLLAGFALLSLWLATSGRERTPVVALAIDVSRGEVVEESHLSTVYVGSDSDISHVAEGQEADVVGRAALVDLEAGTLVTPEQFGEPTDVLSPGEGTVGLSLEAGQLPSLRLAPGDRVTVVAGADAASEAEGGVVVAAAEVVSFEQTRDADEPGGQRRWWVALRARESDATDLAAVVANGTRVHLVSVVRGDEPGVVRP